MKKNVLIIGGGGRECAIAHKLSQSRHVGKIYAAPGNAGIAQYAECVDISAENINGILEFVLSHNDIYLTVVAPDAPLALGLVDLLNKHGKRAFGPSMAAAQIESSKAFSKEFMLRNNIPTAKFATFTDINSALIHLETIKYPTVVKADGLALGKGVIICKSKAEAQDAVKSIMSDKAFGSAGNTVVIEDFVCGYEVTVLAFTDGFTVKPMVSSRDYKRAMDGDKGLNTGGMGCYSPVLEFDPIMDKAVKEIFEPTVKALHKEDRTFKGVLYFDLMVDGYNNFNVIEYNARFGDPETQVVLPRLKNDLFEVFEAVIDGRLHEIELEWDSRSSVCVILASLGYPGAYEKGKAIEYGDLLPDTLIYEAGTTLKNGVKVTNGGRVLGVVRLDKSIESARKLIYSEIEKIGFEGKYFRTDIAK